MNKFKNYRAITTFAGFVVVVMAALLVSPSIRPVQCRQDDPQCEVLKARITKPRDNRDKNRRGYYCQQMKDRNCPEYKALCEDGDDAGDAKSGCNGFDGVWKTNYGDMTITMTGNHAEGKYTFNNIKSTISGDVKNNVLDGRYSQPGYPDKNYVGGRVEFKLTDAGWSGKWWAAGKTADNESAGTWSGTCASGK